MNDKEIVLAIKGVIFDLPEKEKKEVMDIVSNLRQIVNDNGAAGIFAITLVGAELAAA